MIDGAIMLRHIDRGQRRMCHADRHQRGLDAPLYRRAAEHSQAIDSAARWYVRDRLTGHWFVETSPVHQSAASRQLTAGRDVGQ